MSKPESGLLSHVCLWKACATASRYACAVLPMKGDAELATRRADLQEKIDEAPDTIQEARIRGTRVF